MQVSKLILVTAVRECEIQVWHDVHLSAGILLKRLQWWNLPLHIDLAMFYRGGFHSVWQS